MRILVADDDASIRRAIAAQLKAHGFEAVCCSDGEAAWDVMRAADAPPLAVLDWEMPKMTGVEVCRRVRDADSPRSPYLLLITSKTEPCDITEGFQAGVDDYICKPFSMKELMSRLEAGRRRIEAEEELHARVEELERVTGQAGPSPGLPAICPSCNRVRDPEEGWLELSTYLDRSTGLATAGDACPDCRGGESG